MNPQLAQKLEELGKPPPAAKGMGKKSSGLKTFFTVVVGLGVLGLAGYESWKHSATIQSFISPSQAAPATGRRGGGIALVVATHVTRGDIHIYLDGIGQVTPFSTVTVHSRVDGQIMKINFQEDSLVKEGDPIVEIDPRPYQVALEQAQGKYDSDQAFLRNARIDLDRYKSAAGAVTDQQIATQQALVDQYVGNVESDKSQIDAANLNLEYCHISSPITGRIGLQQVNIGNIIHATDTNGLAVITQLQPIAVVFALPEDDLVQVVDAANGGMGLPVQAFDRNDVLKLATGSVLAVDNEVAPTTGTFQVKATFENKDNKLFPNQFVNAHLEASVLKDQNVVSSAAVQHLPDGSAFVYIVNSDDTVSVRDVKEGPVEGDHEALTGVQAGDVVVTDGTDKLQDGTKVNVTFSTDAGATTQPTTRRGRGGRGGRGGNNGGGGSSGPGSIEGGAPVRPAASE